MASTKSLVNYSDDSDDGSVPVKSVASTTLSLPTVESAPAAAPVVGRAPDVGGDGGGGDFELE